MLSREESDIARRVECSRNDFSRPSRRIYPKNQHFWAVLIFDFINNSSFDFIKNADKIHDECVIFKFILYNKRILFGFSSAKELDLA